MKLLTDGEIMGLLTKYANDVRYVGKNRIPFSCLADLFGMHRTTLDDVMQRGLAKESWRQRISIVLCEIEAGRLTFPKNVATYKDPAALPPQQKIVPEHEWVDGAPCQTCRGTKWNVIYRNKKPVRVCAFCIPPEQYKALHLDIKEKRAYKRKSQTSVGAHIADNPRISLRGLRTSVRDHGPSGGGVLPQVRGKRTGT